MIPKWANLAAQWMLISAILGVLMGMLFITQPIIGVFSATILSGALLFYLVDRLIEHKTNHDETIETDAPSVDSAD